MKLENLTIEKAIDNELNIGYSICMDDIIDNLEIGESDNWVLTESEADNFVKGLINDRSISDDEFECKYQHIRDDVVYQRDHYGEVDMAEIARFHGQIVFDLCKRYL